MLNRLQIKSNLDSVSHLLLIETLTGCFFEEMGSDGELFRHTWKILSKLAGEAASFGLIMRKFFEKLRNVMVDQNQRLVIPIPKEKCHVSLLEKVRKPMPKASKLMGVGIIGNGVKRLRVETGDEKDHKEWIIID